MQERSRETRRRLVRTALELWAERGFETGIEDTTVEEIAAAAHVTKGTFYFHFARKEQILLEMGWGTSFLLIEESQRCQEAGRTLNDSLRRLMNLLNRRITAAPPPAVGRALAEFRRPPRPDVGPPTGPNFRDAYEPLFARAQEEGEVTDQISPSEMSHILEALVLDSIELWSLGKGKLNQLLRRRTAFVLAGLHPHNDLSF